MEEGRCFHVEILKDFGPTELRVDDQAFDYPMPYCERPPIWESR